jgi:glutamate racemase
VSAPRILLFDSGMGGLTVAQAVARQIPEATLVYAADNAAFPYGAWDEAALVQRIRSVMAQLIDVAKPDVVVVACNTASTIALADLREHFTLPFVGTVPAIKPAAAQTKTGVIGVLATPGTVKREYTQLLIQNFAAKCDVVLHGAPRLAQMVEQKLGGGSVDLDELKAEISPVFVEREGLRTDVVVLGCTHYPLMTEEFRVVAPWPVTYIDPAPAIARRVADVAEETPRATEQGIAHGTALFTADRGLEADVLAAYARMGFDHRLIIEGHNT